MVEQDLDDYEEEERFTLEFVDYKDAININRNCCHGTKDQIMIERETKVLELLHLDGLL